jgi:hypothetical protein
MYLRHLLLTWVQNSPVGFEKKHTRREVNICAE